MRLLIDECLPRALKRLLRGHTCRTVQEMAWSGIKNGALLSLAEGIGTLLGEKRLSEKNPGFVAKVPSLTLTTNLAIC
jgi:hypothetical protein